MDSDGVAATYRHLLTVTRDTLRGRIDEARKSAVILDAAVASIQASAARVFILLEAWRASLPVADAAAGEAAAATISSNVAPIQATKIAAVETEQVAADAAIEAGDAVLESIVALLDSSVPSATVVQSYQAAQGRIASVLVALASLPRADDLPETDTTLELTTSGHTIASLPVLVTDMIRRVPRGGLEPGIVVLLAQRRGFKDGRRAMVLECADPESILLVLEAKAGRGPALEEAAAAVAAAPRFPHPVPDSSYTNCGGNPVGEAEVGENGKCYSDCSDFGPGCGAGTHHTCCGCREEGSTQCLPGITEAQARANVEAFRHHVPVRCDEVPGVVFPPAAYHSHLAFVAPPASYGQRVHAPLEKLALVSGVWRRSA